MKLKASLAAWGSPAFAGIFKSEIRSNADSLPLQQGLASTSYALSEKLEAMLISAVEEGNFLRVKAGIFFEGIIAGCNCANDPTPVEGQGEYCEMLFDIDRHTGATTVTLSER